MDAIVITHFHLDHWGDLVPWTFGSMFGPGHDVPPPQLWLPPGGKEELGRFGEKLGFAGMFDAFDLRESGNPGRSATVIIQAETIAAATRNITTAVVLAAVRNTS